MGTYALKPRFQAALGGAVELLSHWRVRPDTLTAGAVAVSSFGAGALVASTDEPGWLLAVPVVAAGRLTLNALDGLVAHQTGTARPWGGVLNEIGDRLSDAVLLLALGVAAGLLPLAACVVLLALFASHIGVLGQAMGGRRESGGVMGKADRMVLLAVGAVAAVASGQSWWLGATLAVIAAGLVLTILSRLRSVHDALEPAR